MIEWCTSLFPAIGAAWPRGEQHHPDSLHGLPTWGKLFIMISNYTGWPITLFPTSRWHQNESSVLVWGPCTKMQPLFRWHREVGNNMNVHPVLLLKISVGIPTGPCVVLPQPEEQPDGPGPLRLPGPRGVAQVPRPLQQPDRQNRGPFLPSKESMSWCGLLNVGGFLI